MTSEQSYQLFILGIDYGLNRATASVGRVCCDTSLQIEKMQNTGLVVVRVGSLT